MAPKAYNCSKGSTSIEALALHAANSNCSCKLEVLHNSTRCKFQPPTHRLRTPPSLRHNYCQDYCLHNRRRGVRSTTSDHGSYLGMDPWTWILCQFISLRARTLHWILCLVSPILFVLLDMDCKPMKSYQHLM